MGWPYWFPYWLNFGFYRDFRHHHHWQLPRFRRNGTVIRQAGWRFSRYPAMGR